MFETSEEKYEEITFYVSGYQIVQLFAVDK